MSSQSHYLSKPETTADGVGLVDQETLQALRALPKTELHAHLNGSIRSETLTDLAQSAPKGSGNAISAPVLAKDAHERSLSECFEVFAGIHALANTPKTLTRITHEVLEDYAADGAIYTEIRSTPRALADGVTPSDYVNTVLSAMASAQVAPAMSKLLLSIDRRMDSATALSVVDLALANRDRGVVGIDLSGNPTLGDWSTWLPALDRARAADLPVVLHWAEVEAPEEVKTMLDWAPARLGHGCTAPAGGFMNPLIESKVPLEICLTSNLRTNSVPDVESHHLSELLAANHPLTLCTDDRGVFGTTLTREYAMAMSALSWNWETTISVAKMGLDIALVSAADRKTLESHWTTRLNTLAKEFPFTQGP